jgi:hypothetical protein
MSAMTTETETFIGTPVVGARYGVHRDTVWDWMTSGVTIAGDNVRLRSVRAGRCRKTTWAWVAEFLLACDQGQPPTAPESPGEAARRAERGQKKLADKLAGKKKVRP